MDFNTPEGGKMILGIFLTISLMLQAMRVDAGATCEYDYSFFTSSSSTRYCVYGCCGTKYSDFSTVCCSYSYSSYSSYSSTSIEVPVGVIVGSVIGGLAGLALLIGLIVCCCVAANKSKRRTGTVIQPANTNMQTFVVNSTASSQGQTAIPIQQGAIGYGYPSGGPPPQYGLPNNVYQGYADSANPPPPPPAKY